MDKNTYADWMIGLIKKFPQEKKKELVDKFREKNKARPDVEYLVKEFSEKIGYGNAD